MKEFFVGLLVIILISLFSLFAILLFPLFIVLGLFLKLIVGILFMLFTIWVIGKATLMMIEYMRKNDHPDKYV